MYNCTQKNYGFKICQFLVRNSKYFHIYAHKIFITTNNSCVTKITKRNLFSLTISHAKYREFIIVENCLGNNTKPDGNYDDIYIRTRYT